MTTKNENREKLCIDTIRTLSMDAVQEANSGHPGAPMALAPVAFSLYDSCMKHNPANPRWMNRDRFILSNGHASMLLYSILHITGYGISLEEIKNFRQLGSHTPGHPEYKPELGIETTTGPLGQGAGNSVGMAMAGKWMAERYNKDELNIIDYNVFSILGDGCMMEGITSEAASLAGHLGLDNLIWIYDSNNISIEGDTDLAFTEDTIKRFEGYDWNVLHVTDANDVKSLKKAYSGALETEGKPTLIVVDSHIGYGSPNLQDDASVHGAPLGEEEIRKTKEFYGWDPDKKFHVPQEVKEYQEEAIQKGKKIEEEWQKKFRKYKEKYPELSEELEMIRKRELPEDFDIELEEFPADEDGTATRKSSGAILKKIGKKVPWLIGGAADLAPSTKTHMDFSGDFSKEDRAGRNLHYGVREHAMGAIANGLSLCNLRNFAATFFVFTDYMKMPIRLAAMMELPNIFIFTHDSIGIGEDGPTHQPIEHLPALRSMPNIDVIRAADANELIYSWKYVMQLKDRPAAFILTRQSVPTIDRDKYNSAEGAGKGAYILAGEDENPDIILIATGSEVNVSLKAYELLKEKGINARVVSMPCRELFERQDEEYKNAVIPDDIDNRLVVEAASPFGWGKYANDNVLGINRFGTSAPGSECFDDFGFTPDNIVEKVEDIIG